MERWDGPFGTPNLAGMAMAAVALAAVVALGWCWQTCSRRRWLVLLPLVVLSGAGVGVWSSGSRAAWLAVAVGLVILAVLCRISWMPAAGLGLAGLATVAMSPSTIRWDRLLGGEDPSVQDRHALWTATCQALRDQPWCGLGRASMDVALSDAYLPPAQQNRFSGCLNDLLTVALAWGLPAAVLAAAIAGGLIGGGLVRPNSVPLSMSRRSGDLLAAMAAAGLMALVVCGQFQHHLGYAEVRWAAVALVAAVITGWWLRGVPWRAVAGGALLGGGAVLAVLMTALVLAPPTPLRADTVAGVPRMFRRAVVPTLTILLVGDHDRFNRRTAARWRRLADARPWAWAACQPASVSAVLVAAPGPVAVAILDQAMQHVPDLTRAPTCAAVVWLDPPDLPALSSASIPLLIVRGRSAPWGMTAEAAAASGLPTFDVAGAAIGDRGLQVITDWLNEQEQNGTLGTRPMTTPGHDGGGAAPGR